MNKHEPHFACAGCSDERTFPADYLRTHGGELWCGECWDSYSTSAETGLEFIDLPQFVPEADLKIQALEQEGNELAAQVERLQHERDDALALVIRYLGLLECAIRGEEIIVGDTIVIGIDAELADDIEESFDESPKAALAALKAQWQADQYADGMPAQKAFWEGFERGAIKGPVNIRSHWEEWKSLSQRAQEAGDA